MNNLIAFYPWPAVMLLAGMILSGCGASNNTPSISLQRPLLASSKVVNLSALNTAEDDFAPLLLPGGNTLYWTSNRRSEKNEKLVDGKSRFGEHIYAADESGMTWSNPLLLRGLGTVPFNTGTIAVSADGGFAVFGASYRTDGLGGTDLYRTRRAAMQWGEPECIKTINSAWWDSHPAISPDGRTMVFSSDRDEWKSGIQRAHLWISRGNGIGEWGPPEKLPAPVNSDFSEISPFLSTDGYLYFATNRYPGEGYEIVRSRFSDGVWTAPERLAAPVNSPDDDCFPFVTADRKQIYFASSRPGGRGGLDLYTAGFPYRILLRGSVVLADPKQMNLIPAPGIPMLITDRESGDVTQVSTAGDGRYEAEIRAGREYSIRIGSADCYSTLPADRINVEAPFSLDTAVTRDYILPRVVFPKFELGRFNIPFFVTGYYIPNTGANLRRLQERLRTRELDIAPGGRTPYIDPDDERYAAYADSIEHIFQSIYDKIERDILPLFRKCAYEKELLKIEVKGFVDPRGLTYGTYVDETVETDSMRIERGAVMQGQAGNIKLANLRAYHTLKMIDGVMDTRSAAYRELKQAGRIIYSSYGAGIDISIHPNLLQDPAKRRIDITLSIEKGS